MLRHVVDISEIVLPTRPHSLSLSLSLSLSFFFPSTLPFFSAFQSHPDFILLSFLSTFIMSFFSSMRHKPRLNRKNTRPLSLRAREHYWITKKSMAWHSFWCAERTTVGKKVLGVSLTLKIYYEQTFLLNLGMEGGERPGDAAHSREQLHVVLSWPWVSFYQYSQVKVSWESACSFQVVIIFVVIEEVERLVW